MVLQIFMHVHGHSPQNTLSLILPLLVKGLNETLLTVDLSSKFTFKKQNTEVEIQMQLFKFSIHVRKKHYVKEDDATSMFLSTFELSQYHI